MGTNGGTTVNQFEDLPEYILPYTIRKDTDQAHRLLEQTKKGSHSGVKPKYWNLRQELLISTLRNNTNEYCALRNTLLAIGLVYLGEIKTA